jgi:hypothetical protein
MGFLDRSRYGFIEVDFRGLNEDQNDAILEALLIAVDADNRASPEEKKELLSNLRTFPWIWGRDDDTLGVKLQATSDTLAKLKNKPKLATDHMKGIAKRLPHLMTRVKIYAHMIAIIASDRNINKEEEALLGQFGEYFGFTPEQTMGLLRDVAAEYKATH